MLEDIYLFLIHSTECGNVGRHTSLSHSASLFYDGQEEDKESGNSDCILLSHLEINEATHKKGGER